MFELELSWVGEFTDGVHKRVPEDVSLNVKYYMSSRSDSWISAQVLQNAEKFAKSALEEDSDSDEDMS